MNQLIGYLSEGEQLKGSLTIPKQLGGSTLGTKTITANDTYYAEDDGYDGYSEVTVNVSGGGTLETITKTYTPTTSQQTDTITPGVGYDGIAEVNVTVNAMPTGTEGTPTATKGAVSNHSVAVTPSVTNVEGYINGGTKTGTAVTVSASELVSGTKSISANGTNIDVTNYEKVDVAVPNSYSAGDEGKVVSSGALVAQTAHADVTPTTSDQTIDTTLNNSLKVKGDADLVAGNIKKDVEIFGVTGSYEGGGGGSLENEIISGALSGSYQNSDVTAIRTQAFRKFNSVTSVSFPNVTSIGAEAFRENTGLQSVSFPKVASSGGTAFYGCTNLTSVNMPLLKTVTSYSFQSCSKLESLVVPISGGEFEDQCLSSCTKLKYVDGAPRAIRVAFQNDTVLGILVIRYSDVANLTNISCFSNTPFASGKAGGTLYVPQALVSSYQGASNWSTILGYTNNQIKSIESTHTDPNAPIDLTLYYVDGTPISA